MNDQIAQSLGFDDAAEFNKLVAGVDMTTPEKLADFKAWQEDDGTKEGILELPQAS